MPNPFAHVELSTDDVKKAKKFYASVFAWKLNDVPAMSYTMIDVSGGVGGGIQKKQAPEQVPAWLPYVQVDDVKSTIAKAVKAGGKSLLDYLEIGDMGSIGIFADPQGAALGVWAAKEAPLDEPAPASEKKVAKKAPAKAAPAKAAPAKAAPAKAAPAKAAPAKAAPSKKAPAPTPQKATPPAKAPAKKVAAAPTPTPAPAKKASKKEASPAPAAPAPAKKAPAKKR